MEPPNAAKPSRAPTGEWCILDPVVLEVFSSLDDPTMVL